LCVLLSQETTALGASYAAGLAVGFYKDISELRRNWEVAHTWKPQLEVGRAAKAVRRLEESGNPASFQLGGVIHTDFCKQIQIAT